MVGAMAAGCLGCSLYAHGIVDMACLPACLAHSVVLKGAAAKVRGCEAWILCHP